MANVKSREGQLRIWHIPQIPGKPFHVEVGAVSVAKLLLKTLADYDLFQLAQKVKPDYANAQGLEVFEKGEWLEWESEDGDDINHVMREERSV